MHLWHPPSSRVVGVAGSASRSFYLVDARGRYGAPARACPRHARADRMVMRPRPPSSRGGNRSWQIPRILGSFAKIVGPRTTRRMPSAVRAQRLWRHRSVILTIILLLEHLASAIARRRSAILA